MELIIAVVAIIVLAFIVIISNIHIVQQSRAYVIERLGAFHAVWNVGLHLKIPFIDRVIRKVNLKEQVLDYPPQPVITKDNVTMQIDTVLYFQITDAKLYTYGVENPMAAIETLTATTLRNTLDRVLSDPHLPGHHQRSDARHPGRGHRSLGHQGQPRRGQEHPAPRRHPELHGEADEGRARAPSGDSPG